MHHCDIDALTLPLPLYCCNRNSKHVSQVLECNCYHLFFAYLKFIANLGINLHQKKTLKQISCQNMV